MTTSTGTGLAPSKERQPSSRSRGFTALPTECLLQIFGFHLDLITSTRERLNDLCALSLACRAFRSAAQTCLWNQASLRAPGRAALLITAIKGNPQLATSLTSLSWILQTGRGDQLLLASILELAAPSSLALGGGFFEGRKLSKELDTALKNLSPVLKSFAFGGFEINVTSSDFITYYLSAHWHNLTSLELQQVRFSSPYGRVTSQDYFWQNYPRPRFQLRKLVIRMLETANTNAWADSAEEESWLHWLFANSKTSLRSMTIEGLCDALPEDALPLLQTASRNLQDLSITKYLYPELAGDMIVAQAEHLLSLTLGTRRTELYYDRGMTPVLATQDVWNNRQRLRYLEIQHQDFFEYLGLRRALEGGKLPQLQVIVLVHASRVHPEVQQLVKYCQKRDITLIVKR